MSRARIHWYKDLLLMVCVLCLVVVGLGAFFEPTQPGGHEIRFALTVLGSAAACLLLASSKTVVVAGVLAIISFRSGIAALGRSSLQAVFFAIFIVAGLILYFIIHWQRRMALPYDVDNASTLVGVLAALAGFGLAALIIRALTIVAG